MNTVTQQIEDQLVSLMTSFYSMNREVIDLEHYYFNSNASTLVNALASGTTPATTSASGAFSKDEFISGITLLQELSDFFNNQAVSTSLYISTCDNLRNASHPAGSPLSNDVENIGSRIKTLVLNLIELSKTAPNIEKIYNASGVSAVIGSISASTVVFGCGLTQAKLISGIVFIQQFQKFLNNEAVTQGDYLSTITNFVAGS